MTPSCLRIFQRFLQYSVLHSRPQVGHLVLAVLTEESLGGKCLQSLGLNLTRISEGCFGDEVAAVAASLLDESATTPSDASCNIHEFVSADETIAGLLQITWAAKVFERAKFLARRSPDAVLMSSEHLVLALAETDADNSSELVALGIDLKIVRRKLSPPEPTSAAVPVDFELDLPPDSIPRPLTAEQTLTNVAPPVAAEARPTPQAATSIAPPNSAIADVVDRVPALLDANLNRAREGFRVLEDFARFVLRSADASAGLKQLRHDLVQAELQLRRVLPALLHARDTAADVGTSITTAAEQRRESLNDVVAANARRVQESLRSLEEFGKTVSSEFAAQIKQLRYRTYSLEQQIMLPEPASATNTSSDGQNLRVSRMARLASSSLYVLLTESNCRLPWKRTVEEALAGGADVIQLREKSLSDDAIISRAQWISAACRSANALFIMNDRADLVKITNADGVHIGQTDGTVANARSVAGHDALIGMSTHRVQQLSEACQQNADYAGVGPVFKSGTKHFEDFPGLQYVAAAARIADRPWFAIGGITCENMPDVLDAGCSRVAVCGSIIGTDSPRQAAEEFQRLIKTRTSKP